MSAGGGGADARYRAIVESAIDFAIVATDRDGTVTDWNAGAERVLGWSAGEMLGTSVERFFTPEDRAERRAQVEMASALAQGHVADERWHLRRDGTRFWASGEMMPLRGDDGAHLGFVKILRDRTPQHEFGVTLHRMVARYQALAATQQAVDAAGGSLAGVMQAVVEGALAAVPEADGAVIEMREGEAIVYRAAAGTSAAHLGLRLSVTGSLSGLCMATGRPLVCADSEADDRVDRAACRQVGVRAMLVVPVPHRGRHVGVLKLHAARPAAFGEADLPAAQLLVGALTAGLAGCAEAEAAGALRASEARLRVAQEAGGIGTFEWDLAAGTVALSPTFRQLWGLTEAVVPLADLGDLVLPEDRARVGSLAGRVDGGALAYTEYRIRRPDTGAVRWIARRGEMLADADGRPAGGIGVVYDITAQKEREAALEASEARLRESEDHFRHTVELNPQVPWTCDPAGAITSYSTRWLDLTGQAPGEPDGAGWAAALHPDDLPGTMAVFSACLASGEPVDVDYRVRVAATGEYRWMRARAYPRRDASGAILRWYGVVEDVHDRRRAEAHQRLLVDELNHRVKNTLATVQALAAQSVRAADTPEAVRASLMPRLFALAGAHDILTAESWEAAHLGDLVAATAALHAGAQQRFVTRGPAVRLPPRMALALAMALHELATNAVKYGALSTEAGQVEIAWETAPADEGLRLVLAWRETGGPPVHPPARKGFGSRLIERSLAAELGATVRLSYPPEGVTCDMVATLAPPR